MSERLKPQVKTIVTLTPRHGEDHPSSPALSRRPPLVIIHPDAQQQGGSQTHHGPRDLGARSEPKTVPDPAGKRKDRDECAHYSTFEGATFGGAMPADANATVHRRHKRLAGHHPEPGMDLTPVLDRPDHPVRAPEQCRGERVNA